MTGDHERDNAATHFLDRHLERERGERVAVRDGQGALNYGEVAQASHRVAHVLAAAGIEAGQRVVILVPGNRDFASLFFGVLRRGAVPVPLEPALGADDLSFILDDCQASAAIVGDELYEAAAPGLGGHRALRAVFVVGESPDSRAISLATALANAGDGAFEDWPTAADDLSLLVYARGPEGAWRGVAHYMASLRRVADALGDGALAVGRDDVVLSAVPVSSAYGLSCGLALPLHAGAAAVLAGGVHEVGDPASAARSLSDLFTDHRPTVFVATPPVLAALVNADSDLDVSRARLCVSAGGPVGDDVARRWRERYGVDLVRAVGTPETLGPVWTATPGAPGVAVPTCELRVGVPAGASAQEGELWAASPASAALFWRRREASRDTFVGRWTRTGAEARRESADADAVAIESEAGGAAFVGATDVA